MKTKNRFQYTDDSLALINYSCIQWRMDNWAPRFNRKRSIYIIALLGFLMINSCTTLQNVTKTKVDNRQVEYVVTGQGESTLVFETGLGPNINTWKPILDTLASFTKVFAYNRPGYGNSNIKDPPHHIQDVAEQLHDNLVGSNQKPPYLLIGHSAGGLYVNMFARLYPEEVLGVIFLDSSHPEQFEYFRKHQSILYNLLIFSTTKGKRRYEKKLVKNTLSDFENAPPFPQVPISVLTAGKKSSPLESRKLREQWLIFQNELAQLSPISNHMIVEGSGHFVHKDKPNVVVSEVKRILSLK